MCKKSRHTPENLRMWAHGTVRANGVDTTQGGSSLRRMKNPFRYCNSSPEIIRLRVMMCMRYPLSLRQGVGLYRACDETVWSGEGDRDGSPSVLPGRDGFKQPVGRAGCGASACSLNAMCPGIQRLPRIGLTAAIVRLMPRIGAVRQGRRCGLA